MTDAPTLAQKFTQPPGQIEIPLSKSKLVKLIVVSLVFIIIGIWLITKPPTIGNPILGNSTLIFIVGASSILMFGTMLIFLIKKIFDKKPGLIISDNGMLDNMSLFSAGYIPWSDVIEIKEILIKKQKMMNVVVKDPQDYIKKQKNGLTKKFLQMNYDASGMVIGISDVSLQCSYSELKDLLNERFANSVKNKTTTVNVNSL